MSSNDDTTANLADSTLQKLAESVNQYAATALTSIQVPEFAGALDEDVHDFLRRFKLATLSLTPEMRTRALQKSLTGSAYVWAKGNIKRQMASGEDWKVIKKALINRFEAPNSELRHLEKLAKLKFDPKLTTPTSYIENYVDCFRKANPSASDANIVKALKLNLPNNIIRGLNTLNVEWTTFSDVKDLLKLARLVEEKILPFEEKEPAAERFTANDLAKMFKEFKESFEPKKQQDAAGPSTRDEALAVVQHSTRAIQGSQQAQVRSGFERNNQGKRNWAPNDSYPYKRVYQARPEQRRSDTRPEQPGQGNAPNLNNPLQNYLSRYGRPPTPCYTCSGNHFNRHCPFINLN